MPELTDAQRRAVETQARDVLVIAGAGSGKTRVLTQRVVHLLQNGVAASEIMLLTFTRKAAAEMIGRILQALKDSGDANPEKTLRSLTAGTFHSVALNILRAFGDKLGYDARHITVADEDDCQLLLRMVARDLGFLLQEKWRGGLSLDKVRKELELAYTTGSLPQTLCDALKMDIRQLLNEYWQRLKSMNCLDFGLILLETNRLLTRFPTVIARFQGSLRHVLVDELQDANTLQHYGFLDLFCPPATFFGVGDRRQSIYAFRGARPDLMTERHPHAEIIDLQECFRCGTRIVEAANRLIAVNGDTLAKPMIATTELNGVARPVVGRTADVAATVAQLHKDFGYAWSDIAVMARAHRPLRRLADTLRVEAIPHHRVGAGLDVCETDEFRIVLAALRLCTNGRDNLAFMRLSPLLMDPVGYAAIRARAARDGISHWEAAENETLPGWCGVVAADQDGAEAPIDDVLGHLADTGLPVPSAVVEYWLMHCSGMYVRDALRWHALRDSTDDLRRGDHVTLLTVHAAKGLEFPCVIVLDCMEGDFPSSQAIKAGAVAEERRLAYVAITRAKEHLAMHWRRPEDQTEARKIKEPSRFIQEAGIAG